MEEKLKKQKTIQKKQLTLIFGKLIDIVITSIGSRLKQDFSKFEYSEIIGTVAAELEHCLSIVKNIIIIIF